jgi:hypothetical protein
VGESHDPISSANDVTHTLEGLFSRDSLDAPASYFVPPALCLRDPELVDLPEFIHIQTLNQKVG